MKGRQKGTIKTGGRVKGTPNRTTKEAKELLEHVLLGQVKNINEALEIVKNNDPARFLDSCSKLFAYVLPKKTDVTSDNKPLLSNLPDIIVKGVND